MEMPHLIAVRVLLFVLGALSTSGGTRYDHFKVYQYTPRSVSQMRVMERIERTFSERDVMFWRKTGHQNVTGTFMVSPSAHDRLIWYLRARDIPLTRTVNNMQRVIDRERFQNRRMRMWSLLRSFTSRIPHTYYMRYSEMVNWMRATARRCPDLLICHVLPIGRSYLNRTLYIMKISVGPRRKQLWIDAGIHAREWIAPATALYLIEKLTDFDDEAQALLDQYEFHILPLVNPDGYEYTHYFDRLWRKNLNLQNLSCMGVDLNRNFGYHWGGEGSSDFMCDETYRGRRAFSEPETTAMKNYLHQYNGRFWVYLSLHSYGQFILTPFGYAKGRYPSNHLELLNVGNSMSSMIARETAQHYLVENGADLLYPAAGGNIDYAKGVLGIPYTFAIELPPSLTSKEGFVLDPMNIRPIGREMWIALKKVKHLG